MKIEKNIFHDWVPVIGACNLIEAEYTGEDEECDLQHYKIEDRKMWLEFREPEEIAVPDKLLIFEDRVKRRKLLHCFAGLRHAPEETVLAVARKRGMLGHPLGLSVEKRRLFSATTDRSDVFCEPLNLWRAEAANVAFLLSLLALSRVPKGRVGESPVPGHALFSRPELGELWSDYCRRLLEDIASIIEETDLARCGHTWPTMDNWDQETYDDQIKYQSFIDGSAQKLARESFSWATTDILASAYLGLQVRADWEGHSLYPRLVFRATTQLGTLYAAILIDGFGDGQTPRYCDRDGCKNELPPEAPSGRHTSHRRRFCSSACQKFMKRKEDSRLSK